MAIKRYAPAVEVIERDESEFVQNPRQLYAGFVGYFNQGPVNTPVLVDNEQTLVQTFGKPDNKNYEFWFTASSYLAYSGSLYVVRVAPEGARNSTSGFRPLGYEGVTGEASKYDGAIFNYDDFSIKDNTFESIHGVFAARETGVRGDSLEVYVCQGKDAWELDLKIIFDAKVTEGDLNSSERKSGVLTYARIEKDGENGDFELQKGHILSVSTGDSETLLEVVEINQGSKTIQFRLFSGESFSFTSSLKSDEAMSEYTLDVKRVWRMRNYFNGAPTTSLFAQGLTNGREDVYDEIHVAVVDKGGEYTDVPDTILERFEGLSVAKNAQNNAGDSIFWESYINENSNYIYVINSPSGDDSSLYVGDYFASESSSMWNFSTENIGDSTGNNNKFGNVGVSANPADSKYKHKIQDLWEGGDETNFSLKFNFGLGVYISEETTVGEYNTYVANVNFRKVGSDTNAVAVSIAANTAASITEVTKLKTGTLYVAGDSETVVAANLYGFYTSDTDDYYTGENSLELIGTRRGEKAILNFAAKNEFSLNENGNLKAGAAIGYTLKLDITSDDRGISWNFESAGSVWGNSQTTTASGKIVNDEDFVFRSLQYPGVFRLLGGDDGKLGDSKENLRDGPEIEDSFDVLRNKKELDINLIVSGPLNRNKQGTLIGVAENRLDSVVFLSPERGGENDDFIAKKDYDKLEHILKWKNGDGNTGGLKSSSYTFVDNNWKQVYDRYNSRTRWVPCNGDMAGIVSSLNEPWLSPAGLTNGFIRNALSIAYNPSDAHQDKLYQSSINSIIRKQGQGLVLWGDRTGQEKASAFRSINIRMLFLVVEKALAKYSETLVFELIDEDTMTLARMNINSYLKNVQSRGGIQAFNVILDDSNNTPETIDSQELHVTIRIDATRTINNILLNFVATRSGAAFTVNG